MLRSSSWPLCLIMLVTACNQPKLTPEQQATNQMNYLKSWDVNSSFDPLKSENSPRLVPFSKMNVVEQPRVGSYPQSAKAKGIQGDVLIEVWINSEGIPTKSVAVWGPVELRPDSENYLLKWSFKPFLQDSKPIPVRFIIRMGYKVRDGGPYQQAPKEYFY